jgi:hypothetical protein
VSEVAKLHLTRHVRYVSEVIITSLIHMHAICLELLNYRLQYDMHVLNVG